MVSTTGFEPVCLGSSPNRSSKWKIPKEWLAVLKTVKGVKACGGSSPSSSAKYMVFIVLMVSTSDCDSVSLSSNLNKYPPPILCRLEQVKVEVSGPIGK